MKHHKSRNLGQSTFHSEVPSEPRNSVDGCMAFVENYIESVRTMCFVGWKITEKFSASLSSSEFSREASFLHSLMKVGEEIATEEMKKMRTVLDADMSSVIKNSTHSNSNTAVQNGSNLSQLPDEIIMKSMINFVKSQLSLYNSLAQHLGPALLAGSISSPDNSRSSGFSEHSPDDISKSKSFAKPSIIKNFLFGSKPHTPSTFYVPLESQSADRRSGAEDRLSFNGGSVTDNRAMIGQALVAGATPMNRRPSKIIQKPRIPTLPSVEENEYPTVPVVHAGEVENKSSLTSSLSSSSSGGSVRRGVAKSCTDLTTTSGSDSTSSSGLNGQFASDADLDLVIKMLSRRPTSSCARPTSHTYPSTSHSSHNRGTGLPVRGALSEPKGPVGESQGVKVPPGVGGTVPRAAPRTSLLTNQDKSLNDSGAGFKSNSVIGKTDEISPSHSDINNTASHTAMISNEANSYTPSLQQSNPNTSSKLSSSHINNNSTAAEKSSNQTNYWKTNPSAKSNSLHIQGANFGSNGENVPIARNMGAEERAAKHMSDISMMLGNRMNPVNPTWPLVDGVNMEHEERLFGSHIWQLDDSGSMNNEDMWRRYETWNSDRSSILSAMMDSRSTCSDESNNSDAFYWYGMIQQQQQRQQQQQEQQQEQQQQYHNNNEETNPTERSTTVQHHLQSCKPEVPMKPQISPRLPPGSNLRLSDSGIGSDLGRTNNVQRDVNKENQSTENVLSDNLLVDLGPGSSWSNPSSGSKVTSTSESNNNGKRSSNVDLL